MTLLVHERPGSNSVVVLDAERRMVEFVERPADDHPARLRCSWATPRLHLRPPPARPRPGRAVRPRPDVLPGLAGLDDVYGYPLSGCASGSTPERYRSAEQLVAEISRGRGEAP